MMECPCHPQGFFAFLERKKRTRGQLEGRKPACVSAFTKPASSFVYFSLYLCVCVLFFSASVRASPVPRVVRGKQIKYFFRPFFFRHTRV